MAQSGAPSIPQANPNPAAGENKTSAVNGAISHGEAAPAATPRMVATVAPRTPILGPLSPQVEVDSGAVFSGHQGSMVASPTSAQSMKEPTWSSESLRDLHMSGREPKMFPGVVTRRQRSNSTRQPEDQKLSQATE
jgi:hypothetical protein